MWERYRRDLSLIRPDAWRFLAGSALMGAAQAIPWTFLQLYLDRLQYSKAEIGSILSAEAWGQVLIALPGVWLLARRRTPPLLVLSCLATTLGTFVLPWLGSRGELQACKLFIGCAWWLHYIAIAPFLYRHSGVEERSTVFGLSDAVHTGAGVLGAFTGGRVVSELTERLGSEIDALAWVLSASSVLPFLAIFCYGRIRETAPPVSKSIRIVAALLENKLLLARFVVPQWIVACGAGLCIPFLNLYFQDRFDKSPETVGELYAAWQALATVGFLLSPIVLRRFSFVGSMVLLELGSIPFFLILAFTQNYGLAVFAFLVRGALMNSAGPILKNFMMDASPDGLREAQVALNGTAWGFAWVVGPWLGGWILDTTDSYALLMCTTVGFYLAASASTFLLLRPLDPRSRAYVPAPLHGGPEPPA